MSIEASASFNLSVKKVEFFPYEWAQNLLAVCMPNEVKVFSFNSYQQENNSESHTNENNLQPLMTVPLQDGRIDHFSWSPRTNVATLKPIIQFAVCDNNRNLMFCTADLSKETVRTLDQDLSAYVKTVEKKIDADIVYKISYDHDNGEMIAFTADNSCFLWNCELSKLDQFSLQSSGVGICWHRDEKNKLMVAERSGLIRIYNLETMRPIYTLLSMEPFNEAVTFPLISFDWCQTNPEVVIATTKSQIIYWNTSGSCLPQKIDDNVENLKVCRIAKFKDDIIGYLTGSDTNAKMTILNYRLNQVIYQSNNMKLLNSFSFNAILPVVAIANEQKLTVINLVNQS